MRQINIILKHKRHIGSALASAAQKRKKTDRSLAFHRIESFGRVTALRRVQMNAHSRARLYIQEERTTETESTQPRLRPGFLASAAHAPLAVQSSRLPCDALSFSLSSETANDPFFNTILLRSFIYDKCTFIHAENNS